MTHPKLVISIHDDPPILVCADLQTEYLTEGRRHVIADAEAITARCRELMTLWRGNLWPIIHLKRIAQAAWFNPASFRQNAIGTIGQVGRNTLRSPGAWNADYSAFKEFAIQERAKIQFRGELFNAFNHTNFNNPNTTVSSTTFGRITGSGDGRIVQLAAKVIW